MSGKRALVVIVDWSEEMEVVTPIDVLRRAEVEVIVAGLNNSSAVVCSRQVKIVPDVSLVDVVSEGAGFDAIILPGGRIGSKAWVESTELGALLKSHDSSGKLIATICAAPLALKKNGIGLGKKLTSYPTSKEQLKDSYNYQEDRVVVDGNLITSRGPGTATEWSLRILEELLGKDKADQIAKEMLVI